MAAATADAPLVSVIVPTHDRPGLVGRAVRSALAQSLDRIEVIVVIDGPDRATRNTLATFDDSRLRSIQLDATGGACAARNRGAKSARAPWVALLDDDDEWLPHKLETQLRLAEGSGHAEPVVTCRSIVHTPRARFVLPRRLPEEDEAVGNYIFVRRGLFHGDGFVQTSTLMARTSLLCRVPFDEDLTHWQETDWILRCGAQEGFGLEVAPDVLAVWHADEDRPRRSASVTWRSCLDWIRRSRPLLSERAYAAAIMSIISDIASGSGGPRAFRTLWREAVRYGRPGFIDYATFFRIWAVPRSIRRAVRDPLLGRLSRREIGQTRRGGPVAPGT